MLSRFVALPVSLTLTVSQFQVWHCSGQSNMWLPVSSAFAHNDTLKNITVDKKYHNIRLMAGNSGDCPGTGSFTKL